MFDTLAALAVSVHLIKTRGASNMQTNRRPPLRKSASDLAIDRAVKRVQAAYGTDLARFFADVKKQRAELVHAPELREDRAVKE